MALNRLHIGDCSSEIDYIGTTAKSQFSYDGTGHRTVDVETDALGGVTTTRFLWCGSRICQTRNGSDVVQSRILPEGELNVVSGQKAVYMPDQLGSVRDVLDATSGNVIASLDYSPYGIVTQSNGSFIPAYQYAGLLFHPQSNLSLSATRAHDGKRWINRDPIREPGGINLYGYVKANPILLSDPLGLVTFIGGGGISVEGGFGFEGSFGILLNPGWGGDCFDIGFFGTGGVGGGVNLGANLFVGALEGPSDNLKGGAANINGTVGPVTTTVTLDPKSGKPIGATVGGGIGLPIGASASASTTGTITLNDLLRKIGFNRCGCTKNVFPLAT